MAIYAGLDPAKALQKWYQIHHTSANQLSTLSPAEQREAANTDMVTLQQENPAAWQLVKTGTPAVNGKRQVFNPTTGQFDDQKAEGALSHWETWAQILGGVGLGGVAAAPYLAAASTTAAPEAGTLEGVAAGGGGAATAIPAGTAAAELGPSTAANMAATTAASSSVPTSLAATGGTGLGLGWLNSPLGLGLLGTGINAATNLYGINAQTSAAEKAALLNSQSAADQLAFLKEKDAADRAAQLVRDAEAKREWDTTTGLNLAEWNRRQTQLEPYRQKSLAAGQELSRRLGLPAPTGGWNVPNPPVTLADATLYGGGGGGVPGGDGVQMSPKIAVAPTATDPSLSDPSKWMALVQNDAQLTDFVTKGLGNAASVPGLVDYYKTKVKGQPGANPTEQAGSAAYWNEKFANDPNRTGGSTTLAAVATPTLTRAPFQPSASSLAAFTPIVIPAAQPTTTLANLYQPMNYAV